MMGCRVNRRDFFVTTGSMAAIGLLPFGGLFAAEPVFAEEELLGKGEPAMFGEGFNLRQEAAEAFDRMRTAALKEGIDIYSVSSYRNYDKQKSIWDRKFSDLKKQKKSDLDAILEIIRFSTIPGTSRHHWGTDLDIVDQNPQIQQPPDQLSANHFTPGGVYHPFYQWLKAHANSFGFYEVYIDTLGRKGFEYEPWHWSYAELSIPMLKQYSAMNWQAMVAADDLPGHSAMTKEFLSRYYREWILGINPELLPPGLKNT